MTNWKKSIPRYCLYFGSAVYFMYHTFHGDRGLIALSQIHEKKEFLEDTLRALCLEKNMLENKISLMGEQIDKGILDMQVRHILGYVDPEEVILPDPLE